MKLMGTYSRLKTALALFSLLCLSGTASSGQKQKQPDPCADAQSQAEMNICAGKKFQAADTELNRIYKQLVAILDGQEQVQLKDVENTWLKYRDANCNFVADQYKGGSIRPTILGLCLEEMTRHRTAELKDQIKERSN